MNDHPVPLDVAHSLVDQYGEAAIEVAENRAELARKSGQQKVHDQALMVLTHVEKLLREKFQSRSGFVSNDGSSISTAEMLHRLNNAKPVLSVSVDDIISGKFSVFDMIPEE